METSTSTRRVGIWKRRSSSGGQSDHQLTVMMPSFKVMHGVRIIIEKEVALVETSTSTSRRVGAWKRRSNGGV